MKWRLQQVKILVAVLISFSILAPMQAAEYITKEQAYLMLLEWLGKNVPINSTSLDALERELEAQKEGSELAKMQADELERRFVALKQEAENQRGKYNLRSNSYSYLEYWDQSTTGNGGNPRLRFARILTLPIDKSTEARASFDFQKGLGSNKKNYRFTIEDFSIKTTLAALNNTIVTVGRFEEKYSPFILHNITTLGDEMWGRKVYNGLKLETSLLNLDVSGFISRTRRASSTTNDGYHGGLRIRLPWEKPTSVNLTLFSDFTDPGSGSEKLAVKKVAFFGLDVKTTAEIASSQMQIEADLATSFLQEDTRGGFTPQRQFAGLLQVETMVKMPNFSPKGYQWLPLAGKVQYISPHYPTGYGAIRDLEADFIYRYEEKPYSPDCPRNTWLLELTTGTILPAYGLRFTTSFDLLNEINSVFPRTQPRRFSHYFLNGKFQLGKLVSNLPSNLELAFDLNIYNTKSVGVESFNGVSRAQQRLVDTYLSLPDSYGLKAGINNFRETSFTRSEAVAWGYTLFGEARARLGNINLTWRQSLPILIHDHNAIGRVQLTRVRGNASIGPGVDLNLRFDIFQEGAEFRRSLWLEMITVY